MQLYTEVLLSKPSEARSHLDRKHLSKKKQVTPVTHDGTDRLCGAFDSIIFAPAKCQPTWAANIACNNVAPSLHWRTVTADESCGDCGEGSASTIGVGIGVGVGFRRGLTVAGLPCNGRGVA